ncbi:hypothetical protein GBA52_010925 [Prunus armeniaca]|nr:hypothetical protein GBA52_010925 [Prunus armeniaca]
MFCSRDIGNNKDCDWFSRAKSDEGMKRATASESWPIIVISNLRLEIATSSPKQKKQKICNFVFFASTNAKK